jgi:hypothetical protein
MIRGTLRRLAHMSRHELSWRATTASRTMVHRAAAAIREPRWARPSDAEARHRAVCRDIFASTRFLIVPAERERLVARLTREYPHSARDAASRADRVLFGEYDLLGYRGLRFDRSGRFEWNYDPVHDKHAPGGFWSTVRYLDAASGDHKIIWELNRHQHWIALGRAYWLTGASRYRERCLAELTSWLDANPPLSGVNWTSMLELAIRSLSWIWALHFFADPDASDASPWAVDLVAALERQITHIEQNLSHYFSPNTHLTGEALALYVAGRVLPQLERSARWADIGRRVLVAEIDRQIGADGGHRERSAHYHRYTHDFYALALTVARLTDDAVVPTFAHALAKLAFVTRAFADDRGRLPHLGDDDGGVLLPLTGRPADDVRDSLAVAAALLDRPDLQIGAAPEETLWWLGNTTLKAQGPRLAGAHPLPSVALEETGYYISRSDDGTQVIVDGGPHGYLNCGHAHADALALTLTVRGVPLLIDPGTGCYTIDRSLRDRMRSTALHNTVTVGARAQSIPAGPFHWSQTTDASVARWRANDGFDYFDGLHDGYVTTRHRRRVLALHHDLVLVADLIEGGATQAALHWHLDPRWRVELDADGATLATGADRVRVLVLGGALDALHGDAATGLGFCSPAYGRVDATHTLRVVHDGDAPFWFITVVDLSANNPVHRIETIPIWTEAGVLSHGTAVRLSRATSTDYALFAEPNGSGATWRVAEFETDARVLFCRTQRERRVTRLALVDGSFARTFAHSTAHSAGLQLVLPTVTPDLHLDLTGEPRMTGPSFGARLVVNGREHPLMRERRAAPRSGTSD